MDAGKSHSIVGDVLNFIYHDGKLAISPIAVFAIAALPLLIFILNKGFYPSVDAREPIIIPPKIPFIGHIISIFREGTSFYKRLL
jgi:hypothetical protein